VIRGLFHNSGGRSLNNFGGGGKVPGGEKEKGRLERGSLKPLKGVNRLRGKTFQRRSGI